jgi:hypothetical protein
MKNETFPTAALICSNKIHWKYWVGFNKRAKDSLMETTIWTNGGSAKHRPDMTQTEEEAILARRIPKFSSVRGL